MESYRNRSRCFECAHYFFNNGEDNIDGCRAFPNGIPEEVQGGFNHQRILENQEGDYIYRKAKVEELSPFAQYLYRLKHKKMRITF